MQAPPNAAASAQATVPVGLSTADKLGLANTIITGFAAAASLAAVIIAVKGITAQRKQGHRERKSTYYRAVLLDPALTLLGDFETGAAQLIAAYTLAIEDCTDIKDARRQLNELAARYSELLKPVRNRLLRGALALRQEQLRDDIGAALLALEDLNTGFDALVAGTGDPSALEDQLREQVSELLGIVIRFDLEQID